MSTYVFGTSLSYRDYLQARSFTDSLKSEISSQTRLIIASDEELQRERIRITEKTIGAQSQVISTGLEQLSLQFQDLRAGISELNATFEWGFSELNATFEWGFSELLTTIGQVNDSLSTLIGIAKTPAQTWAYEQFDIARDAFRQRLYEEALEYLDRAINGYASNTGYKLEYRFHYLLGSIRLGSFTNNSPKIVNLIEAEKSFLNAARYARQDQPMEAGRANLAAGWGAYCQGKMDGAKEHTKSAISCYRNLPEAHFQLAKIHMHLNEPDTAVPCLKRAIELDRRYSIKAFSDGDFKRHEAKVRALLTDLRREERERAEKALIAVRRLAKEVEGQSNEDIVFPKNDKKLGLAKHALEQAANAARHDTYFGYHDAYRLCEMARLALDETAGKFRTSASQELARRRAALQQQLNQAFANRERDLLQNISEIDKRMAGRKGMGSVWDIALVIGLIVTTVSAWNEGERVYDANTRQAKLRQDYINRAFAEIRKKGYDPNRISVQKGRELGYGPENTPPENIGKTFIFAAVSSFLGGCFLTVLVAWVSQLAVNGLALGGLKAKKDRVAAELAKLRADNGKRATRPP